MKKLILFPFVLLLSCQSNDPVQNPELSIEEEKLRKLKTMNKDESTTYTYHEFRSDTVTTEEKQSVLIEQHSENQFLSTELYNIYQNENGVKEYYVMEMRLDVTDTTQRQQVLDYRLFESADSVFLSGGDVTEILIKDHLTLSAEDKDYEILLFNGYSHLGDPEPVNLRFWSPIFGTLLIWYGNDVTYELVRTGNPNEDEILTNLRKQIRLYLSD